jgi:hypothetical protein
MFDLFSGLGLLSSLARSNYCRALHRHVAVNIYMKVPSHAFMDPCRPVNKVVLLAQPKC